MYINIGGNTMIPQKEIIGFFDLDNTTVSKRTRLFLNNAEKEGKIINIAADLPKSFILCSAKNKNPIVYLSQLSTVTLLKRRSTKNLYSTFLNCKEDGEKINGKREY